MNFNHYCILLFQILLLLLGSYKSIGQASQSSTYFVYAKSGLSLRLEASTEAEKITVIPYGAEVAALSDSLYGQKLSVEAFEGFSLEGYWKHIQYDTLQGYVFEPYLLKFPVSLQHKDDKEYFQEFIGQQGDRYNLKFYNLDCASQNPPCVCGYEASYNQGIVYKYRSCLEKGISVAIVLSRLNMQQAFLLSKMLYRLDEYVDIDTPNTFNYYGAWSEIKIMPEGSGAGCYYTIEPYGKEGTVITYYCSC